MPFKIKLEVIFSKTGDMRFISHLDLTRVFQRACRRAALSVTITQGFSPHLKISIKKALKLGLEGRREEAFFYLDKEIAPEEFVRLINEKLPEGVRVISARMI